jgi:hypothetical protein
VSANAAPRAREAPDFVSALWMSDGAEFVVWPPTVAALDAFAPVIEMVDAD